MLIILDKHSGVPIFRQIVDQAKHMILTGQVKPGEQVTSVKDLSEELQINPMTISKAYSLLEHEGFVERRRGIGLFAIKPEQSLTLNAKTKLLQERLEPVVVQAIQMGLNEHRFISLISALYKTWKSKE